MSTEELAKAGTELPRRFRNLHKHLEALREGLEAFLIVAITLAYLRKTGRTALLAPAYWGAAAAVALSIVLGVALAEVAVLPL